VACDPDGRHAGEIRVPPGPSVLVSVTLAESSYDPGGRAAPAVSLTGLHPTVRTWRTTKGAGLAIVALTPLGAMTLFPGAGGAASSVIDLGAVVGDQDAHALAAAATAAPGPRCAVAAIEAFLRARSGAAGDRSPPAAARALEAVARGHGVAEAAVDAGVSRRTLHRAATDHLGLAPQVLAGLARLRRSVSGVQGREGGAEGYADQAHQIRDWTRRLGATPGAYRRAGPSPLAQACLRAAPGIGSLYL
jgi:AraC-like DNA-binding protein